MTYRKEWKGRLKVSGTWVYWDGAEIGQVWSRSKDGATSPKGMVTNTIWFNQTEAGPGSGPYQSMDLSIEALLSNVAIEAILLKGGK